MADNQRQSRRRSRCQHLVVVSALCCSSASALAPVNRLSSSNKHHSSRPYSVAPSQHDYPFLDRQLLQQRTHPYNRAQQPTKRKPTHQQRKTDESQHQQQRAMYEVDDIRLFRGARNAGELESAIRSVAARFWSPPVDQFRPLVALDLDLDIDIHIGSPPLSLATPHYQSSLKSQQSYQYVSTRLCSAALRSIAHIQMKERRTTDASDRELQNDLLKLLEERLFDGASVADLHALTDIMDALGIFVSRDGALQESLQPLAQGVVHVMIRDYKETDIGKLTPAKLSIILQGISQLELDDAESTLLVRTATERASKPDAIAKSSPTILSHSMESVVAIASTSSFGEEVFESFLPEFLKISANRFRKKQFRSEAKTDSIIRAVSAISNMVDTPFQHHIDAYATTVGYTVIQDLLNGDRDGVSRRRELTLPMITELIAAWSKLERLPSARDNTVVADLFQVLVDEPQMWDGCTAQQLEGLLSLMAELRVSDQPRVLQIAGEKFRDMVMVGGHSNMRPRTVSNILRVPALTHRESSDAILDTYLSAAQTLFRDENFLSQCKIPELDNFLWVLSMVPEECNASCRDLVKIIVKQILERKEDIASSSPRLASRVLSHSTKLICSYCGDEGNTEDEHTHETEMRMILHQLFYKFGRQLLSSHSLSPTELASSVYAYAKATYVGDMGTFDHLVSLLVDVHDQCSTRELSQSLWACGKMALWESAEERTTIVFQTETRGISTDSSHVDTAWGLVRALAARSGEMSTMDLAQTIWALGRMQISELDPGFMSAFIHRAKQHASVFEASEIANILWGLSKTRTHDSQIMSLLSDRIIELAPSMSLLHTGSILTSLGVLQFRHSELFELLSESIRLQVDEADAHDIAHVLLAHSTAKLPVPSRILDDWAAQKLGLPVA